MSSYLSEETANRITFDVSKYGSEEEMFREVMKVVQVLIAQEYICILSYDDVGIYCLDFNYDDEAMGTSYPYWLKPYDYEDYLNWKSQQELPFGEEGEENETD